MSARQYILCFQLEIRSIKQFWRQFLRNTTAYFNRRCDFKPGNISHFSLSKNLDSGGKEKEEEGRKEEDQRPFLGC